MNPDDKTKKASLNSITSMFRIFVVEDDAGLNKLICRRLKREKFQTSSALSGDEALKIMNGDTDEILLLDYRLTDMTAANLVDLYRKRFQRTPHFIVMTGFGDEKTAVELMKSGALDYLVKEANFLDIFTTRVIKACKELYQQEKLRQTESKLQKATQILFETGKIARTGGWELEEGQNNIFLTEASQEILANEGLFSISTESFLSYFPKNDKVEISTGIDQALTNNLAFDIESPLQNQNGQNLWVRLIGKPQISEGKRLRILGIIQDITSHKEVELELLASNQQLDASQQQLKASFLQLKIQEEQFKAIFDGIDDLIYISDPETYELIHVNDTAKEFWGQDIVGQKCYAALHGRNRICAFCKNDIIFKQPGETHIWEFKNEKSKRWYRCADKAIEWPDGRLVHFQIASDITQLIEAEDELISKNEQLIKNESALRTLNSKLQAGEQQLIAANQQLKADEEELIRSNQKLQQQEQLLRFSISQNPMPIIVASAPDVEIIYFNDAACDLMAKPMENLHEMTLEQQREFWPTFHPDGRPYDINELPLTKAIKEGIVSTNEEIIVRHADRDIWISANAAPLHDDAGKIIAGIVSFPDITQQKRSERQLYEALAKARESDRLKSAFLANMSHEIRTPMNGILGFLSLLNNPKLSDKKRQEFNHVIEKSSERLLNTINDLIDISKIEAGQVHMSHDEVHVNSLLNEILAFFTPEAEKKDIDICLKPGLPTDRSCIFSDHDKLYAIISNLMKNALKFTNEGSITLSYIPRTIDSESFLEFTIADTGIGIPPHRQKAIFNRFEQADIEDTQVFEGSGLGLSIAKAYIELLGGNISVKSAVNEGSSFTFTIPFITLNDSSAGECPKTKKKEVSADKSSLNIKVLLAEDDDICLSYLLTILEEISSDIIVAKDGKEAVEKARKNPDIDIILMDIKLPEMNGYKATQEIRKFNKDVIIIAQTAYALLGDKEKALQAGCNDYISKPIEKHEFIELLYQKSGKSKRKNNL